MMGIYKITSPNGFVYIGQSKDIEKRLKSHKANSANLMLRTSIKIYGLENHVFEVICECSEDELLEKEKFYIYKYMNETVLFNKEYYCSTRPIELQKFKVLVWFRYISNGEQEKDCDTFTTNAYTLEHAKMNIIESNFPGKNVIPFKFELV